MHGTVLIDARGESVLDTVPLWNNKRTRDMVQRFQQCHEVHDLLQIPRLSRGKPSGWPGSKKIIQKLTGRPRRC
jgi:xylulokinase